MPRPRSRKYVSTTCHYSKCQAPLERPAGRKRYFCSQSHYWAWRREEMPASELHYQNAQGELLADLQRVANELGHKPSLTEYSELGHYGRKKYYTRFGTWQMALGLITDPAPEDTWNVAQVSEQDGGWLVGFSDGESTFRLAHQNGGYSYSPVWGFQIRADDAHCLIETKRILGLPARPFGFWHRDHDRARGINAGDAVRFYIRDVPTHVARTLPFFRRFPLRSKKAREFEFFAEAVELEYAIQSDPRRRNYLDHEKTRLQELYSILKELKLYVDPRP